MMPHGSIFIQLYVVMIEICFVNILFRAFQK